MASSYKQVNMRQVQIEIGRLLDAQLSDYYIRKRVLVLFGILPAKTDKILDLMRKYSKIDLTKVPDLEEELIVLRSRSGKTRVLTPRQVAEESIMNDDNERRWDADFGNALGLDWPNHD